jgi:hypothetical protein
MDFFVTIIVPSFLVLEIYLIFIEKGQFKKGRKERLQRETLNPFGAFILDPSGKSIS